MPTRSGSVLPPLSSAVSRNSSLSRSSRSSALVTTAKWSCPKRLQQSRPKRRISSWEKARSSTSPSEKPYLLLKPFMPLRSMNRSAGVPPRESSLSRPAAASSKKWVMLGSPVR